MYIPRKCLLQHEIKITTHQRTHKEMALLDGGTTENFMDQQTVQQLWLGAKKISQPRKIFNVDETENKAGTIKEYIFIYLPSVKKNLSYSYLFPSYPQNKRNKTSFFLLMCLDCPMLTILFPMIS